MQEFGQLLLIITFFVALATALTAMTGALTRNLRLMNGARSGLYAIALLSIAMAVVLTHGFLTHDFSNKYIATYSDRSMPLVYLVAAFWGGEKGALLFWVTSLAIFSAIAVYTKRERSPVYLSWVVSILAFGTLFFLILMVFEASPFETFMTSAGPAEGQGLNPLLQNPVMAFHPPALLTGYIMFTIPFAFGMAALITRKLDDQWITDTRRWTIVSWAFLSVGLLLGARWAYMEIGWGFWWMWDPVENAGLVPWFTATAFLHSVMIQERRGMLKRWNVILVSLTFLLTIVGTFLTRSQLIVSIHAFADSKTVWYFFGYMIVIATVAGSLIAWRWRGLKSEARIESLVSRESAFVLNNVVLVFCAFIVLWGTLMGKITESETVRAAVGLADPLVWDENTFNEIFVPVGFALLVLMAVGPLISWRRATARNLRKNLLWPMAWAAIVTLVITAIAVLSRIDGIATVYGLSFGEAYDAWLARVDTGDWLSVVVYFLCAFVLAGIGREFHLGAKVRRKKHGGGYLGSLVALTAKNPRRYGGYLVHISVVFMFIAFTGKAFQVEEKDRLVAMGSVHVVDNYSFALVDRDRYWSVSQGCAISNATFVVLPIARTVAEREVDRLVEWLTERDVGVFHVETQADSPFMRVRFEDVAARPDLLLDDWLSRRLGTRFRLVSADEARRSLHYVFDDEGLARAMPFAVMEALRDARARLTESGQALGLTAEISPGMSELILRFDSLGGLHDFRHRVATLVLGQALGSSLVLDRAEPDRLRRTYRIRGSDGFAQITEAALTGRFGAQAEIEGRRIVFTFADRAAFESFEPTLSQRAVPDHILAVIDNPELGAVEIVDEATGVALRPELRFFPRAATTTTEVAISGADFLVDVYISMQPSEDGNYVKLYTVIFPLVNFLWLGAMMLVIGSAICLIPRWLGQTIVAMVRGRGASTAATVAFAAVGLALALAPSSAHARVPEPQGFAVPAGGDAFTDLLGVLSCDCPDVRGTLSPPSLAEATCACPGADTDRGLIRELLDSRPAREQASGRAKYDVLRALRDVDPGWDLRFRYDEARYQRLLYTVKNTCPGEKNMTLAQSKSTCTVRSTWLPRFRLLLTAGLSDEDLFAFYVAENNVTMAPSRPWQPHELRSSEERTVSYGVPLAAVFFVVAGLGLYAWWNRRRRRRPGATSSEREDRGGAAPSLSKGDKLLLADELDGLDY